ncbi:hypothetical protein EBT25_15525, partial [bacterium]|nr:hypothetical protein [bacterium]
MLGGDVADGRTSGSGLEGQDRFQTKKGSWFNAVASYETAGSKPTAGLYIYPFALRSA